MSYEVNFAGINLSDYCTVLNVERGVLPPRENFSKSIPTMNGSFYTGYHYGERTISLEILIKADTREDYIAKVRKLADVIHTENPCKLILGDEPEKYYFAVVDGETLLSKAVNNGTLTLNFICHDPVAYSDEVEVYETAANNAITIKNNGTTDTYMDVAVEFQSDACFFSINNSKGNTVLIGKTKNMTKKNVKLSPTVTSEPCESASNFTSLPQVLLDDKRTVTGNYGVGWNGNGIVCTNYGTAADGQWTGTAFRKSLGRNVEEFEVRIDFVFSSKGTNYKANSSTDASGKTTYGTYEVTATSGLIIRESNSGSSKRLAVMKKGTKINVTDVKGTWAKHTTKIGTSTYTGWSCMTYLKKVTTSKAGERAVDYADDELGLLEVYGYDQDGAKLFKCNVSDTSKYYEYVTPRMYVGTKKVLAADDSCPAPRKVETKDKNGKVTSTTNEVSGTFGDWNDLDGKFVVKRVKKGKKYLWTCELYAYKNGKVVKKIKTANSLSSSSFPTGNLNYLGFYIGRYGSNDIVDLMTITHIKVTDLSSNTATASSDTNAEIFSAGDRLNIDFENGEVTLNGQTFLNQLDIGSDFFKIPTGNHKVRFKTDDENADITAGITERFL